MRATLRRLTLNRGIILVNEMALDELDREAGFTHTTASDDYQLRKSQYIVSLSS